MSVGGRAQARRRMLRRAGLIAGVLVLLALVFLASGHWVLGAVLGAAAAAAVWVLLQVRTVR
ncbi:MAG TPA: hypothetical protein VNH40_04885 [Gaiellaceae bacterium]|nr:hypothetical protein [Gaiellaceae bacterium]